MGRPSKTATWENFNRKSKEIYGTINITPAQARDSSLVFYKGSRCEKGHDGYRYTTSGNCRLCSLAEPYDNSAALEEGRIRKKIQDRLEALSSQNEYDYL